MPNIKGFKFSQNSLNTKLQNAVAGQRITTQTVLLIIVIVTYLIAGFSATYVGAITGLEIVADAGYRIAYILSSITILVWIGFGIKSFRLSMPVTIVWFILIPPFLGLYSQLTKDKIPYNLGFATIFQYLAFSIVSFSLFCYSNALFKVIFEQSKLCKILKMVVIFNVLTGCILAAFYVIEPELQLIEVNGIQELSSYGEAWSSSFSAKATILLITVIYPLFFTFSAVFSDRIRKIMVSPSSPFSIFLRALVFSAATWQGTSFYDLDLSYVDFMGAKLANTDLRAYKLYRTCFQGVIGLERARVDNRYLDLDLPKVQKLLTHGCSEEQDFSRLNLRGAYLQRADLQHINFTDTELTGADLKDADVQSVFFVRANVTGVDFSRASLTGICIQDWNVNTETLFTNVECDYVYRKLDENGNPTDRFPSDRNFEPREFESLYQEVGNVVELIFQEGVNWRAFAFTLQKLQLEDEGLGLELKGIEKRGDLWVVKVTHDEHIPTARVEQQLKASYENLQQQLANKEQQINQLLGIVSNQAESLKELSKKPFGNHFTITGSTITNLAGGEIEYTEAADQVRSLVAGSSNLQQMTSVAQTFLEQLQNQNVATSFETQVELIEQIILSEAQKDKVFEQFLRQQSQQILDTIPNNTIASAIQAAIVRLG